MTRYAGAAIALLVVTGGHDPDELLVLSQVVLSLALPFALVPLVWLTMRTDVMGSYKLRGTWAVLAILATTGIVLLDGYLLVLQAI